MSEIHWLIIFLIIAILWIAGLISLAPSSENKAKKELAKTILKDNRGVFK